VSAALHPSDDLLRAYADGRLPATPGLAVAAHLGACPSCASRVRQFEELGGAALLAEPGLAMASDALERALEGLSSPDAPAAKARSAGLPPAIGGARLGLRFRFPGGVWMAPILSPRSEGWRAVLVHAPAGAPLPVHDHSGAEYTYVVEGAYTDGGARYCEGDFAVADTHIRNHSLLVTAEGPCTCLIATQGRLRFRAPLSLIAPLIGL
jgi:putative transcriptional regulator